VRERRWMRGDLCLSPNASDTAVCTTRCFTDIPGFECRDGARCGSASDQRTA
jgi:hypothetical protein